MSIYRSCLPGVSVFFHISDWLPCFLFCFFWWFPNGCSSMPSIFHTKEVFLLVPPTSRQLAAQALTMELEALAMETPRGWEGSRKIKTAGSPENTYFSPWKIGKSSEPNHHLQVLYVNLWRRTLSPRPSWKSDQIFKSKRRLTKGNPRENFKGSLGWRCAHVPLNHDWSREEGYLKLKELNLSSM